MKLPSAKLGGLVLISSSILTITSSILHPMEPTLRDQATVDYARLSFDHAASWGWVHSLLILAFIGYWWGYRLLYERVAKTNQALPALGALTIFSLVSTVSLSLHAFIEPLLSRQYFSSNLNQATNFLFFSYNYQVEFTLIGVAFTALAVGLALFGWAILSSNQLTPWVGYLGILVGLGGLLAWASGLFGPYWVNGIYFPIFAFSLALWSAIVGIQLYRSNET